LNSTNVIVIAMKKILILISVCFLFTLQTYAQT